MIKKIAPGTMALLVVVLALLFFGKCNSGGEFKRLPNTTKLIKKIEESNRNIASLFRNNLECYKSRYNYVRIDLDKKGKIKKVVFSKNVIGDYCEIECTENAYDIKYSCTTEFPMPKSTFGSPSDYCEDSSARILNSEIFLNSQTAYLDCQERDLWKLKKNSEEKAVGNIIEVKPDIELGYSTLLKEKEGVASKLPTIVNLLGELKKSKNFNEKVSIMQRRYDMDSVNLELGVISFCTELNGKKIRLKCWDWGDDSSTSPIQADLLLLSEDGITLTSQFDIAISESEADQIKNYCEDIASKILIDPEIFPKTD